MLETFWETIKTLAAESAFANISWQQGVMILLSFLLMYLAIVKKFEPLLLLPIAFGMALTNIPGAELYHPEFFMTGNIDYGQVLHDGGLLDILYLGVKLQLFPPLIFLGIGTMTDFGPLIANPKSFLLGAAAQAGIFFTFIGACLLSMTGITSFTMEQAASIGIIGGADGPTAIFVTSRLAPEMLGSIAVVSWEHSPIFVFGHTKEGYVFDSIIGRDKVRSYLNQENFSAISAYEGEEEKYCYYYFTLDNVFEEKSRNMAALKYNTEKGGYYVDHYLIYGIESKDGGVNWEPFFRKIVMGEEGKEMTYEEFSEIWNRHGELEPVSLVDIRKSLSSY